MKLAILSFLALFLWNTQGRAETTVTTYVTHTQEERRSTRFTLTEWLNIKERMKLMDVWLAMFAGEKDKIFVPEINLSTTMFRSKYELLDKTNSNISPNEVEGIAYSGEIFLTNILRASTGLRLLNIDFGLGAYMKSSKDFAYLPQTESKVADDLSAYSVCFRLFGKSVQDSSLVFRAGQYQKGAGIFAEGSEATFKGMLLGGEFQGYLVHWLGADIDYTRFGNAKIITANQVVNGHSLKYSGFIEVSLFRIFAGAYSDEWIFHSLQKQKSLKENGLFGGLKVFF